MTSDVLSQEEINALLEGDDINNKNDGKKDEISNVEKDALGEIGNISMGTAATTLSTLLNQKVVITTPRVAITTVDELSNEYKIPFVAVDVKYKSGLEGTNVLILKVDDVKIITDIMMGKKDANVDRELTELDLSAVSEVMNQMMGSSCTSLSEIFSKKIDIEPPKSYEITFSEGNSKLDILKSDKLIVKVYFRMIVGDAVDSQIMQLIPIDFAKEIVDKLLEESVKEQNQETSNKPIKKDNQEQNTGFVEDISSEKLQQTQTNNEYLKSTIKDNNSTVAIKKPQFQSFDNTSKVSYNETIDLVGEIPVQVTAELGRTTKKIEEILEYGPGAIIELDKLVGEPLNVYANGKFIARGEVVVIDDNFGIRITDIVNPYKK